MTDTLWYTRCPVPTASGVAHARGWLEESARDSGLTLKVLQDSGPAIAARHFDHDLEGLIREGGNVPALAARAAGSATRLIGLTWIDEAQAVVVRGDSDITDASELRGARLAVPSWAVDRARSFPRAMALHGFVNALNLASLRLSDVRLVEVDSDPQPQVVGATRSTAWGIEALVSGEVDAVYIKGARARDLVREHSLRVVVDLDATANRSGRVNNGTPRPITVHQALLDERPDVVVDFLVRSLRAADWAAEHPDEARAVLQAETGSAAQGAADAYPDRVISALHPGLDEDRLALLDRQKQFLGAFGFLDKDFELDSWIDPSPLACARDAVRAAKGEVHS